MSHQSQGIPHSLVLDICIRLSRMISRPVLCFGVLEQHVDPSWHEKAVCLLLFIVVASVYLAFLPVYKTVNPCWKARWDLRKICAAVDKSLQWTTEPQHSQHHKTAWKFLYVCHTPLQGRRALSWMSSQLLEKWHKLLSSRLWSAFTPVNSE